MDHCDFCKNRPYHPEDFILETDFWTILLGWNQQYVGKCLVVLNRHCGDLAKLTKEEWGELLSLIERLEASLRKTFPVDLFNWSCLMNGAFQGKWKEAEPHVHWHITPRYHKKIIFENEVFEDKVFGHHYNDDRTDRTLHPETRKRLMEKIKKNL